MFMGNYVFAKTYGKVLYVCFNVSYTPSVHERDNNRLQYAAGRMYNRVESLRV